MCDHCTTLARLDHRRWIGCCEHGTVHLAWDRVLVRLPLQKLQQTAQALCECAQVARHFRIAASAEICVVFDEHDYYQVWVSGVGFCLAPHEFHSFCQLISSAGEQPAARAAAQQACDEPARPDFSIRTTYHLFSVN